MSNPLKNKKHLLALLDDLADDLVAKDIHDAEQTKAINLLKKAQKSVTGDRDSRIKRTKARIARFVRKNIEAIFGNKTGGTIQTNQTSLQLAQNPPAIKPINKDADEQALVNRAISLGFDSVVKTESVVSRKALSLLEDDELEKLGFHRTQGDTITITLLANTSKKAKAS